MFDVARFTLAAPLAAAGTVTVGYPALRSRGNYLQSDGKHTLVAGGNLYLAPRDFTLTFNANASNITLTWGTGMRTLPQSTACVLSLSKAGQDDRRPLEPASVDKVCSAPSYLINLGSPNAASANGVSLSQSVSLSVAALINGALASGGVATFDVPRNVVGAWTNTAIVTVTGTDEYGNVLVEQSASGVALAGKKAFKTVTSIVPNANITGATFGTGDVLGLPVALPALGHILKELENGATAAAGTPLAAVVAKGTATTGDVRGTYDPNSACDGDKGFSLIVSLPDPTNKGVPQYAG